MKNEYTADVATLRQQLTNPPGIGSKLVGQQGEQTGGAVSEDAITEAARALCAESSRACNVDKDDNWNLYADEFKAQARIVVEAVAPLLRAPGETESKVYACPRCATSMQVDPSAKPRAPAERGGMVDEGDIEAMRGAAMEIAHNKEAWFPMTDRRLRRAAEVLVARRAALAQNAQPCDGQACVHCDPEHGCKPAQNAQLPWPPGWFDGRDPQNARGELVSIGFRYRMKGSADAWLYNDRRSPDEFELRECEIESVWVGNPGAAIHAERARVPAVTFDMVKEAEFFCPTDLPTLKRLRWKAKRLTELLGAPPQPEDAA